MTMPPLGLYLQIKYGHIKVTRYSPAEHRFWSQINQDGPIHPVLKTRCWDWTGYKTQFGYGRMRCKFKGPQESVHRYSWELYNGPIPKGLLVLHKCDRACCTRPSHLFLGTDADNSKDRDAKGRGIVPIGERAGSSKLTEEQVRYIRKLRLDKPTLSFLKIGKLVGVSSGTAQSAIKRMTWKHVK